MSVIGPTSCTVLDGVLQDFAVHDALQIAVKSVYILHQ